MRCLRSGTHRNKNSTMSSRTQSYEIFGSKTVRCRCPHLPYKFASNRFREMRRATHRSAWMIWWRSSTASAAVSPVQQSEPGRRADRPHCNRHSFPECVFSLLVGTPPNTALSSFAKRSSNAIALFAANSSLPARRFAVAIRRTRCPRAAVSPASVNRVLLSASCASSTAAGAPTACSCSTFYAWLRLASRSRCRACLTEPTSVEKLECNPLFRRQRRVSPPFVLFLCSVANPSMRDTDATTTQSVSRP